MGADRKKRLLLIGGGGHCLSVLDTVLRMGVFSEICISDRNFPAGSEVMGCRVAGDDRVLPVLFSQGFELAFVAVGSIKSTKKRRELYQLAQDSGFAFPNIIDPSAAVSERACLGQGIFIGKNAVVNAGVKIGDMAIINSGAVIEHGCLVGDFTHVAVGAAVCGDTMLEEDVFVGAGAVIAQEARIGKGCIIGAGSVVFGQTAPNSLVRSPGGGRTFFLIPAAENQKHAFFQEKRAC